MRRRSAAYALVLAALLSTTSASACSNDHSLIGLSSACTCGLQASADHASHLAPDPEPGVVDVLMTDFTFSPEEVTVTPGTTVRWTNLDAEPHDTISLDFLWQSQFLGTDQSFSYTFTDDSFQTFFYICSLHGGMFGSVNVTVPEPGVLATSILLPLFRRRR